MKEKRVLDCIFCKIVNREIPAQIVGETALCLAFLDVFPRQPVHVLVVPKSHHKNVAELAVADPAALTDLVNLSSKMAEEFTTGDYRLTFNTGANAGQTVFHAHGHVTSRNPKDD